MRSTFQEYHPFDQEVLANMWDNAVFIFDTNVLLNLYRYSANTSEEFIQTIINLNGRIWLPFHVGLEFNRNRLSVISEEQKNYSDFQKNFDELISKIENKNRNPFFSNELTEKFISLKQEVKDEIDAKIGVYESKIKDDPILDKIDSAFNKKVGYELKVEEIEKIHKEGEKRYKKRIPPGYCDNKKPENEKFGDLIIWKEIISKSKELENDIIFILDDRKEDWWFEHHGKTISPRPELLKEFRIETSKQIHFYKPFQFLEFANAYLQSQISEEVIQEVKNYKPKLAINENYIQITYSLIGKTRDFHSFASEIRQAGYEIVPETSTEGNTHLLNVTLPNIPDLERRLNSKFIARLSEYNLDLSDKIKIK